MPPERRAMRAFTIALANSEAIDNLVQSKDERELRLLFGKRDTVLDKFGLTTEDYIELAKLLPKRKDKHLGHYNPKAENPGHFFFLHLQNYISDTPDSSGTHTDILREVNRRIAEHKRSQQITLNSSRVADALITLGLATLAERKQARESVEGSARPNDRKGENKLPITQGSEAVTV